MPEPGGVVVAEPVAPVVAAAAELRLAFDGFELAGVRAEAEVAAADGDGRSVGVLECWSGGLLNPCSITPMLHHSAPSDRAAGVAVGSVDPVVQA